MAAVAPMPVLLPLAVALNNRKSACDSGLMLWISRLKQSDQKQQPFGEGQRVNVIAIL